MKPDQLLEAILFAAAKPVPFTRLRDILHASAEEVSAALEALRVRLVSSESALVLQEHGQAYTLVTHPEAHDVAREVAKGEVDGELTRPSLETLSILAYCGPMTRPELEQIRGVQSSMILRNLMLRGLVEEREEERLGQSLYAVTFAVLNHLGIRQVTDLPDYNTLHGHANIVDTLRSLDVPAAPPLSV